MRLTAYRWDQPRDLRGRTAQLLFFWATCTDEPAVTLDAFFKGFSKPFPETVAIDEYAGPSLPTA